MFFFFFKQKTAYEMRISDWSSDVCSSDLAEMEEWLAAAPGGAEAFARAYDRIGQGAAPAVAGSDPLDLVRRETERWRNHFADLDAAAELLADELRSEERRVGQEGVSTCRSRWTPYR